MSTLQDKLTQVSTPKQPESIIQWLKSLSPEDRSQVWTALRDSETYKTFTLLRIFNEEGGKFGKDSFVKFRTAVLAGSIKEDDVHGSK